MEVKLSHQNHLFLPISNPIAINSLSIPRCKMSFKKHFRCLAESCRFHFLEISKPKGQSSNNHCLIHVVKNGETLNSISRQYGVSIHSIVAANNNLLYVHLFKGQLLNIPPFAPADTQLIKKKRFSSFCQQETSWGSLNILDGILNKKPFIMLTTQGLPNASPLIRQAKSSGYFLVLVPLIAFCITCIIGVFHTGDPRDRQLRNSDKSREHHDGSRSMRWKSALSDLVEPNLDSESRPDSISTSEDEDQNLFEDMSHAYSKLEHDYQKFLSECGMSKSGYWRGGSNQ